VHLAGGDLGFAGRRPETGPEDQDALGRRLQLRRTLSEKTCRHALAHLSADASRCGRGGTSISRHDDEISWRPIGQQKLGGPGRATSSTLWHFMGDRRTGNSRNQSRSYDPGVALWIPRNLSHRYDRAALELLAHYPHPLSQRDVSAERSSGSFSVTRDFAHRTANGLKGRIT
jgi:hypothetical protein